MSLRECRDCGKEFTLMPGKPGYANVCPACTDGDVPTVMAGQSETEDGSVFTIENRSVYAHRAQIFDGLGVDPLREMYGDEDDESSLDEDDENWGGLAALATSLGYPQWDHPEGLDEEDDDDEDVPESERIRCWLPSPNLDMRVAA